jgi:hypothetical protein
MPTEIVKNELAESFRNCVQNTVTQYCRVTFTKDAKVEARDIIEYESRMRVFGLEKFNDTCYIALLNLFESPLEKEKGDVCGVLIIYVEEENAEKLFKAQLKGREEEDDELIVDFIKELCSAVYDSFKVQAHRFGYPNLLRGDVENYRSNIEEGVLFPYTEDTLYQVNCSLWREKVLVAELVLAPARRGG